MNSDRWNRIWELFHEALEQPGAERRAWVTTRSGDDTVALEVLELLESHERGASIGLDPASIADRLHASARSPAVPERIAGYRIIRVIASGGMGIVYEAEQDHPRRRVALKVLHPWSAGPDRLRRFELELQVLARLRHPGIAQLHEAGTFDAGVGAAGGGSPYFAMELIPDPLPVTEYARLHALRVRERLELFIRICEAVHFGHLQGVIHRDLKPANILVERGAANPQPKVIDFGVARATGADLASGTLQTTDGQIVGTLQYMSPEQCASGLDRVDARSDVYALGVVLFELLCGRTPYEIGDLPFLEAVRTIRETAPARPSSIVPSLRGDLETVVLKALRKEPQERFASAAHLAEDVHRVIDRRPISARPPSAWYSARMYVRRNRLLVGGSGVVAAALVAGVIAVSVALTREIEHARRIEHERNKAVEVNGVLRGILESVDPVNALENRDISVREAVDRIAAGLERGDLRSKPDLRAAVLLTLGNTYRALGHYDRALPILEESLALSRAVHAEDHSDTAAALNALGIAHYHLGHFPEARTAVEEALAMRSRLFGGSHRSVAESHNDLALVFLAQSAPSDARSHAERAVEIERNAGAPRARELPLFVANRAAVLAALGDHAGAEAGYREALDLYRSIGGEQDPSVAVALNNLGEVLHQRGDFAQARRQLEAAQSMAERLYGPDHPYVAVVRMNRAAVASSEGRAEEARELYEHSYAQLDSSLVGDHPRIALALNNLGEWFVTHGNPSRAKPLLERALEIRRARLGARSIPVATTLGNLGACRLALDEPARGLEDLRASLDLRRALQGHRHPETVAALSNLAVSLFDRDEFADAAPLLDELLERQRAQEPVSPSDIARTLMRLGMSLMESGRHASAEPHLRECVELRRALGPVDSWPVAYSEIVWGSCCAQIGRGADAIDAVRHGLSVVRESRDIPAPRRSDAERRAAAFLAATGATTAPATTSAPATSVVPSAAPTANR